MGRVLTNNVSISYSIETALGVAGLEWFLVEPNAINVFGATITTVARDPISRNRQRRKGTTTDLDSSFEFDEDLTISAFRDFLEGFCFVTGINSNVQQLGVFSAETTGDTYVLTDDIDATQNDALEVQTLIWVNGMTNSGNNGLKEVDTDVAAAVAASGVLTFGGTPVDAEIVTIDAKTYTFQTTLTNADGNVLIGSNASDSLDNLIAAINLGSGAGTTYAAAMTEHPTVTAAEGAGDTMDATAKDVGVTGNLIITTTDVTAASWGAAVLVSGTASRTIAVADNLTDEAAAPTASNLSVAGYRILSGETVTWAWNSATKEATLSSTGKGTILGGMGLTVGMTVHIGSVLNSGDTVIVNAFESVTANDMFGYARVKTINADTVVFNKVDVTLQFDDNSSPSTDIDILFGEFVRNVSTTSAEFLERSFQFEMDMPNLDGDTGNAKVQYSKGNFCNTLAFGLPLTDKASISFGFIGTDTDNPIPEAQRKTGTGLAIAAFGTLTLGANAGDTDIVTIGSRVYTFQTSLTDVDGNVNIGASASDSLDNLIGAITLTSGIPGTDYALSTTVNPEVTAVVGPGDTMDVTALLAGVAGNDFQTSTDIATSSWGFTRLSGGSNGATDPTLTGAYNTSADIARLRITEADEDGLTTDFKSLTLTINNNVSPEKVLGTLGARFINTGNFEVDIEAQILFTNSQVINAIRDNETITMDFVIKNDDGVIAVDIPSMTLGGGDREFPVNESVLLNSTGIAFQDATLGYSMGVTLIPVPLP